MQGLQAEKGVGFVSSAIEHVKNCIDLIKPDIPKEGGTPMITITGTRSELEAFCKDDMSCPLSTMNDPLSTMNDCNQRYHQFVITDEPGKEVNSDAI